MRARLPALALSGLILLGLTAAASPVWAQSGAAGDAEAVRRAANSFDAGGDAYRTERYAQAASHFEAADEAVPSARALRMALRARLAAKQYARALTHAAQALARYPDDDSTSKLAKKAIADHVSGVHRIGITCSAPCLLVVGTRVVPGTPRSQWVVYVAPGDTVLGASFVDGSGADKQQLSAAAGGDNNMSFMAPAAAPPKPDTSNGGPAGAGDTTTAGGHDGDGHGIAGAGDTDGGAGNSSGGALVGDEGADQEGGGFITSPGVFIGLAVVTAALGGVTVWSGLDTVNNPGADTVREICVGQGTACPEYQLGLDKQLRTNVLIGVTAGAGALTAIFGIFVTEWGGGDEDGSGGEDDSGDEETVTTARPTFSLRPTVAASPWGAALGFEGTF